MEKKGAIIFITGGGRSGKSQYAVKLAQNIAQPVVFVATCIPEDEEMAERVRRHKQQRPAHWTTIEQGRDLSAALREMAGRCRVVIVDCLTLFVSNLLLDNQPEEVIVRELEEMIEMAIAVDWTVIVVSNEVGSGLVPETKLGRAFRDIVGRANQLLAERADDVYLMVSGLPIKLKGAHR